MATTMGQVEVLRAACCVAGLDQQIDDAEYELLQQLATKIGVGRASLAAMIDRARTDPDFYQKQFNFIQTNPTHTMTVLFAVATADHKLTPDERIILHHFAERLEMSNADFDALLDQAETNTKP